MKHSIHFPSLFYPLAWKSRDLFTQCFFTIVLSFLSSHPVDEIRLNIYLIGLSHLEMLESLWLFIGRKMLRTGSVPNKRFWDSQRFHCRDLLPALFGGFMIELHFLISKRTNSFSLKNFILITYRNGRNFKLTYL